MEYDKVISGAGVSLTIFSLYRIFSLSILHKNVRKITVKTVGYMQESSYI